MGSRGGLDMIVFYMKNNVDEQNYKEFKESIALCMTELIEISRVLHREFPDIVPKELL